METEIAMSTSDSRREGGQLNAALANQVGKLMAEFTGRGPTRSHAFIHQDTVVCVLEDGATKAETKLVEAGQADFVRRGRDAVQRVIEPQLIELVERITGRTVRAFLSGTSTLGESSVEVFLLEPVQ